MEIGDRMTRLEALFEAHLQRYERQVNQMEQLHKDNRDLINAMDQRMDRHDLQVARVGGALALLVVLANLFGPLIVHWLGLS